MSSATNEFQTSQGASDFVFVVFVRGHWCPFCIAYLKTLESIRSDIAAAHGRVIVVTSESPDKLPETRRLSKYDGEVIVDPENSLAKDFKARGLVDVAISSKSGYPNGMAQPAVLVLTKENRVLYQWAIVPSLMNLQGAKDRPSLKEVWEDVRAELKGEQAVKRTSYSKQTIRQVLLGKVFG